jgi:hypothetical protein
MVSVRPNVFAHLATILVSIVWRQALSQNIVVEIAPFGIDAFDQLDLPSALPFLDLLLSLDGRRHVVVQLNVDKQVHRVFLRETRHKTFFVLPEPLNWVPRHASV